MVNIVLLLSSLNDITVTDLFLFGLKAIAALVLLALAFALAFGLLKALSNVGSKKERGERAGEPEKSVKPKINPVKLKQDADKLEKAGRYDQAIAIYRQIVDDNPRDWNVHTKLGGLYANLNRNREAADEFAKIADFYAKNDYLLKAIAIWKVINRQYSALEPHLRLAGLYAKQGLTKEAKSECQILADELTRRGRDAEALEVVAYSRKLEAGGGEVGSIEPLIGKISELDCSRSA
jgi:tetratricopeptide (TPR) repeat protein